MRSGLKTLGFVAGVVIATLALLYVLTERGVFNTEVWERDTPLRGAVPVTSVRDGVVTLADERSFRPAGVRRADGVSTDAFDDAIRVTCAQGVVVTRDLGDGSAFLLAEPKFYNWCGTRGYRGNPWARWAGSYFQCPVSELLVQCGYATADTEQAGLTTRERWRLEGVGHVGGIPESPRRIAPSLDAIEYDADVRCFEDLDGAIELMWKPAPG
jgi:hypothetical protein